MVIDNGYSHPGRPPSAGDSTLHPYPLRGTSVGTAGASVPPDWGAGSSARLGGRAVLWDRAAIRR